MKLLHISALSALLIGAAALTTPVLAADDNSMPSTPAAQSDNSQTPSPSANTSNSANTQVAMNNSSSDNSNSADLSSIPDNSHKFSQSKLGSENASEDQTTKALNEQESKSTSSSSISAQ
jgi:hypothetical protein